MEAVKPSGWYYIGQGKLRYRDDHGWTDYHMSTDDPRTREWPPPSPESMVAELRADLAEPARRQSHLRTAIRVLLGREQRHSAGRHRATA
jgi:hypothetical protein